MFLASQSPSFPLFAEANLITVLFTETPVELLTSEDQSKVSKSSENVFGAESLFFGRVRRNNQGREVVQVEYDAFVPLAEAALQTICDEAEEKWGTHGPLEIRVVHRLGPLRVGEISVLISVQAKHRSEAFEACRYVIDELKTRAPIWKKESYTDGATQWLDGHALCQHRS